MGLKANFGEKCGFFSILQDSATVAPNEWSDGEDEEPDREATDEDATGEE